MSRIQSSLDRFSDSLTPMNYSGPPTNLPMLLSRLGVSGKPQDTQRVAVKEWLKSNTPVGLLPFELEDEGYI